MSQKVKPGDFQSQKQTHIELILSDFQKQGVLLVVVGENSLSVKGKMTSEQKENIHLWKRQLIDELSPKCPHCTLPMKLIQNGSLWFCPIGCKSFRVEKL